MEIPCLAKSVVLKGLWTQLYYPTLLSPVFDLTFDNDVQGKSAGWNILYKVFLTRGACIPKGCKICL